MDDDAIREYLRRTAFSPILRRPAPANGTDAMSVVDAELKVHGIANLRIADGSVMPAIVSGNTNAAVLAIAERAASLLTGELAHPAITTSQSRIRERLRTA